MKLEDLLAADALIPSLPEAVNRILGELQHEEPDLQRVNRLLSGEVGLTVRLLRLVNSARYSTGGQRIGTVEAATAMLGLNATRQLVQAAAVGAAFRGVPGVDMTEFWRHSLDVAKIAQSLAEELRLDQGLAFTAGLLHGTGDLIMKMAMPDCACLRPAFAADDGRYEAQVAELGFAYPEVGAAFAARWLFPDNLVEAIRFQCEPRECADPTYSSLLYLACWSARAHELDIEGNAPHGDFPQGVAQAIGLSDAERLRDDKVIAWTPPDEARDFT
ncbi:HDOD domain-containing protein [Roseateles saccharophilus]|uniref:HD-like signal output (HDOD) protein n=1 Tax=Roseateles saccharophilus TaxID=304 RepID=A0A4V6P2V7_ROSSA|nr:HDOD domain-containing protein [Roseateles saccharophilus]TCV03570.1 HD-like signal output (HDOD) protein [Roseateles saccharophilus]